MSASLPHPLLRRTATPRVDPALQAAVDALASRLRKSFRKLSLLAAIAGGPVAMPVTVAAALEAWKGRAVAALFSLPGARGRVALLLDHALVCAATEAILGGDGSEPSFSPERAPTRIEMRIARILAEQAGQALLAGLETGLESSGDAGLRFEKLETNLDFCDLGTQPGGGCITFALQITIFDQIGSLSFVGPADLTGLFAKSEPDEPAQAAPPGDPAWSERLSAELAQADIRVEARFEDHGLTLGDVAKLRVGQQLELGGPGAELILESNEHILFYGRLGQADGRYAVRIENEASGSPRSRSMP